MVHKFDSDIYAKTVAAKTQIGLSELSNKTYEQVQDYVETQVTDLASAKVVLKKMAIAVLAILKERDLST